MTIVDPVDPVDPAAMLDVVTLVFGIGSSHVEFECAKVEVVPSVPVIVSSVVREVIV